MKNQTTSEYYDTDGFRVAFLDEILHWWNVWNKWWDSFHLDCIGSNLSAIYYSWRPVNTKGIVSNDQ